MARSWNDPRIHEELKALIRDVINDEREQYAVRHGTVVSVNNTAGTGVVFLGKDGNIPANLGAIRPAVGQIVRVEGEPGDRYITDIVDPAGSPGSIGGSTGDLLLSFSTNPGYEWLYANGSTVIPPEFTALAALIGGSVVPNLRDRFFVAAGNLYGVGATGGVTSITVAQANLTAFALTVTDAGHIHQEQGTDTWLAPDYRDLPTDAPPAKILGLDIPAAGDNHDVDAKQNTKSATTGITVASGGSGTPISTLPPYFGLRPYVHA